MQQDWEVKELKKKDKATRMFKTETQSFNSHDFVGLDVNFYGPLFISAALDNTHSSHRRVSKGSPPWPKTQERAVTWPMFICYADATVALK